MGCGGGDAVIIQLTSVQLDCFPHRMCAQIKKKYLAKGVAILNFACGVMLQLVRCCREGLSAPAPQSSYFI